MSDPKWNYDFDDEPTTITGRHSPVVFFDGRFQIERLIAVGGMGFVYQARDTRTFEPTALKVLRKDRATDGEMWKRFRREVEMLEAVRSPHIVRMLTHGSPEYGMPWFAMELLRGATVSQLVRREGRLTLNAVVRIVDHMSEALSAIHEADMIHRDLKPSNIFVPDHPDGHVKLIDFGISTMNHHENLTQVGMIVGTPRYIAPERLGGSTVDHRADIYSLGITAFEALTGRSPFLPERPSELLVAIAEGERFSLDEIRPELEGDVCEVLNRALAADPENRFSSAREFAYALRRAAADFQRRDSEIRMSEKAEDRTGPTEWLMEARDVQGPTPVFRRFRRVFRR